MRDDELKKAIDTWAESERESAPDLRPTAEMVHLLRAKQEPRRGLPIPSRRAMVGAAAAVCLLTATLLALVLRLRTLRGRLPVPEATLIAQREGPGDIQTAIVKGGATEATGKGPVRGQAVFQHLLLQAHQQDSPTVRSLDLLDPPEEPLVLTPADNYRLVLEMAEEHYVYIYQLTSSGSLVQLFPNLYYSAVPEPLQPGQLLTLPAQPNWLYLDEVAGEERLYIVASPQVLQELDDVYTWYSQELEATSKQELLSDLLELIETIVEAQPGRGVEFVFQHR